jgi:hypothetical protein
MLRENTRKINLRTDTWNVNFVNKKHSNTHLIVPCGPFFEVTMFHWLKTEIGKEIIASFKGPKFIVIDPLNKPEYKVRKILKSFERLSLLFV